MQRERVPVPRTKREQGNCAPGVDGPAAQRQVHLSAKLPETLRKDRGRPGVQTVLELDAERSFDPRACRCDCLRRSDGGGPKRHDQFAPAHRAGLAAPCDLEALGLGDDDRRDETARISREAIGVETDERLPGSHAVAGSDNRLETRALKRDCVDADMQEQLCAMIGSHRHCVGRLRQGGDFAVAGRTQNRVGRIDRDPVPEHACCEHFVVHFIERPGPARER